MKPAKLAPLFSTFVASVLVLSLISCPAPGGVGTASISIIAQGAPLQTGGSFSFGNVQWGTPREVTFTIRNDGTATLTLTSTEKVSIQGANPNEFSLTNPPAATVAPSGGTTTFTIRFAPSNEGAKSAAMTIQTDVSGQESISFTLTGSGVKGWRLVGTAGFSAGAADYVSLAVDSADGTPYVAYVDQSIDNGYPQVKMFTSGAWSTLADPGKPTVTDPYFYTSIYILDSVPNLAYSYKDVGGYAIRVMSYDSVTPQWNQNGSFDRGTLSPHQYLSLKADSSGWLFVAFRDNSASSSGRVSLWDYAESSWNLYWSNFTPNANSFVSLGFIGTTPFVAFKDDVALAANVYCAGDGMNPYGSSNFSAGEVNYTSLAVDSSSVVYVAYSDVENDSKVTVMKNEGSDWTVVGETGFSASAASYVSLAIGSDDTPYVAYKDAGNSNKVTVQKFNGTSWELVGTAGFSSGSADYVVLVLNETTPFVAFNDGSAAGKVTVMKFQ